jgi:hypothetical protein
MLVLAPAFNAPIFQTPVNGLKLPPEVSLAYVNPAGRWSLTSTAVASLGPLFVTVRVNVTFPPTGGVTVLAAFVIFKSAIGIITTLLFAVLFAALLSLSAFVIPVTVTVPFAGAVKLTLQTIVPPATRLA